MYICVRSGAGYVADEAGDQGLLDSEDGVRVEVLVARGLAVVPVTSSATLSLAERLTAGLLGVLVLGERFSVGALLGASLMVAGLGIASVGREAPPNGRQEPGGRFGTGSRATSQGVRSPMLCRTSQNVVRAKFGSGLRLCQLE